MDCEIFASGSAICGNFAERTDTKPESFDYDHTAKWYEAYPFDWRETLGGTVCNCSRVKVNYAPYFGYDYFHLDSCNLMRKLDAEPGIYNLVETYLPAINHYTDAVPNSDHIPLYIKGRKSKGFTIKVERRLPQLSLI